MWYINGYGVNVTSAAALDIGEQSMIRAHTKETVKIQAQMRTFTKSSWLETVLIHIEYYFTLLEVVRDTYSVYEL